MSIFLHGVETIEIDAGPRPIKEVKSAVIGLIGTAKTGPVNTPTLVLSDRDNVQFGGPNGPGELYTIPAALKAIQDQGAGVVIVVNVYDPSAVTPPQSMGPSFVDLDGGTEALFAMQVAHPDDLEIRATENGSALEEGTDYTLEWEALFGQQATLTVVPDGALDGAAGFWFAYTVPAAGNLADYDAEDILGGTTNGKRTGAQALLDAASLFGFGPKILIAPGYSALPSVGAGLAVLVQESKLRAIALLDPEPGISRDVVLAARAPNGDMALGDERILYCYPWLRAGAALEPPSARMAGVIAATDAARGYWHSPSNKPILGVTGIETPLTASINDPSCDVNALNAAGVVTVFTGYGAGIRVWGNRSSAFPSGSDIKTFVAVRRTIDMVDEAIEQAALAHLDGPITEVLITAILDDVNSFLRTLIGRGALMSGSRCEYFAEDNEASELAAGHITFTKTFCPPPPAERITYQSVVDTTLLRIG